ncbi:MAG TPA: NAD(P)/FAD-dependent oxidoreductase [Jatrophihabitans sp.]|nr:NAD(P)/FAD-dependent oxidoreductase [Jatrophihabitans sp.]
MTDAVVVGSGPNGLAAAVALARAGVTVTVLESHHSIGGGTRTEELTVAGVLHDVCSAVHPLGVGSPFLSSLDLGRHGLEWCWPEIDLAHPLDGGRAAALVQSVDQTADGLGADGRAWRRLFAPLAARFGDLGDDILRPIAHRPRHPLLLARFGLNALAPAAVVARRWRGDEARALFGGMAAHAFRPLSSPTSASVGLALGASAHRFGWPVAKGGSRAITDALAAELVALGGQIETGHRVTSLHEVDGADVVMLDLAPSGVLALAGDRLPARIARAYRRYRTGPAAYKVDLAVEGGVPWTSDASRRAGTVHLGGTIEQVAAAEREVAAGRLPARPFVLVAQQYLADPSRSAGDVHPIWAYAHVPNGYSGDATDVVLDQLERFAPGVRGRIVGQAVRTPAQYEEYNPNFVGGDISTGANDPIQVVLRPRMAIDPYRTGIPGVYLCSAATPPGGGVHGMCGANAAASALKRL